MADEKQNPVVHVHYVHHIYHPLGVVVPGMPHQDTLVLAPGFYPQTQTQTQTQAQEDSGDDGGDD